MSDVRVDPGALAGSAGEFRILGDDLRLAGTAVAADLSGAAGAAGDGGVSGALSAAGAAAGEVLMEVARASAATAAALTATADNYARAEDATRRGFGPR